MSDNADRTRHYGIRVGDDVEQRAFGTVLAGEVTDLHLTDNNGATIRLADGKTAKVVCEWCHIVRPVEDKTDA